jgi:SAM-dependent methyltransferase
MPNVSGSFSIGVCEEALARHQRGVQDLGLWQFLAQQAGSVLELGCGSGRVLLPLIEMGLDAVGLEKDPELQALGLEKLSGLLGDDGAERLVLGDLRSFELDRDFALVIVPFNTYCLVSDAELKDSLASVAAHLRPGGTLFVEAQMWPNSQSCEFPWEQRVSETSLQVGERRVVFSEQALQENRGAPLRVKRRFCHEGEADVEYTLLMQIRTLSQWDNVLAEAGFQRVGTAHDAQGKPVAGTSRVAFFQAAPLGSTKTATAE